ncbi:MAG: hypothetical protein ACLQDV_11350 [Candidatus Binataceae bacterium]
MNTKAGLLVTVLGLAMLTMPLTAYARGESHGGGGGGHGGGGGGGHSAEAAGISGSSAAPQFSIKQTVAFDAEPSSPAQTQSVVYSPESDRGQTSPATLTDGFGSPVATVGAPDSYAANLESVLSKIPHVSLPPEMGPPATTPVGPQPRKITTPIRPQPPRDTGPAPRAPRDPGRPVIFTGNEYWDVVAACDPVTSLSDYLAEETLVDLLSLPDPAPTAAPGIASPLNYACDLDGQDCVAIGWSQGVYNDPQYYFNPAPGEPLDQYLGRLDDALNMAEGRLQNAQSNGDTDAVAHLNDAVVGLNDRIYKVAQRLGITIVAPTPPAMP